MLTIFNRRELLTTFSTEEQIRVRDILSQNGVEYRIKAVNPSARSGFGGGSRAHTGSLGVDLNCAVQYTVYVYAKDLERARSLI